MFPLYIWMVTGLLLIALVLFVFAQAAVTRSGGQSAADAAALAAAHESRDQLHLDFAEAAEEGDDLEDILDGEGFRTDRACDAAADLAGRNGGSVAACSPDENVPGYHVEVETDETVGESVIPATENATARADASAVIESRCTVRSADERQVELDCEDGDLEFDPSDDDLPEARDLFRVVLED